MTILIKLSTGKEIELTSAEFSELMSIPKDQNTPMTPYYIIPLELKNTYPMQPPATCKQEKYKFNFETIRLPVGNPGCHMELTS